jgi:hypothetical protein
MCAACPRCHGSARPSFSENFARRFSEKGGEMQQRKHMKNRSIKSVTAGVCLLLPLSICTGVAQSGGSTPSALQQLKDTNKEPRAFDGNPKDQGNSTLNATSTGTVNVPVSSGTATGVSQSSGTATTSGNSNPQLQKLSNQSLHIDVPPPVVQPKTETKQEPKKTQPTASGTVPTGK